jgi:putative Mg2+ transporter-C (MgtC) family protein
MNEWMLILRLVAAGLMGGLIGLERELRAKEAGVRTHFIVALGSALFMIISQYAFDGQQHDASRVAAQVVSGIGFIGAGVIIFQKNVVRGVTTAAGLWVAAAIGLSCGGGLYIVAGAVTLLTILCLEMMHWINLHYADKLVHLTLAASEPVDAVLLTRTLEQLRISPEALSVADGKAFLTLRVRQKRMSAALASLMDALPSYRIEELS